MASMFITKSIFFNVSEAFPQTSSLSLGSSRKVSGVCFSSASNYNYDEGRDPVERAGEGLSNATDKVKKRAEEMKEGEKEYGQEAAEKTKQGTNRAAETAERTTEATKETKEKAAETAQSLWEKAKRTVQGALNAAKETMQKIKETVVGKDEDDREKTMD